MNNQLKELTLIKFKETLNNLKGNDLKDALRDADNNEAFHNWIGDAFDESCRELNLDVYEIQETQEDLDGLYWEDCYNHIDKLRESN